MSHTWKLLLAVPLGLLLAAEPASAQPKGKGVGPPGGIPPGQARMGGGMPRGYIPGIAPGPYYGNVAPVGHPAAYFGNVRPAGYPRGIGGPSYLGYGYPYGGYGYPYGGLGIGGRYPNYSGYGYGLTPPPGYGPGYPIRVGDYGERTYGDSGPAYPAVLGVPATVDAVPGADIPPPRPVGEGKEQPGGGVAVVTVLVPDGADLWFDGEEQEDKTSCQYVSKPIPAGQAKTLEIKVKWDGSTSTLRVPLRAGDKMTIDLRNVK
jgi:hypothetical protein